MTINRDCLFCAGRFTAKLERRLFCSDICRVRYNREERLKCFYCGDLASDREHVTPHSATNAGGHKFNGKETVNCCSECNTLLGTVYPYDLQARINYLYEKIIKKYQLDVLIPEWADEEFEELGYTRRTWRLVILSQE